MTTHPHRFTAFWPADTWKDGGLHPDDIESTSSLATHVQSGSSSQIKTRYISLTKDIVWDICYIARYLQRIHSQHRTRPEYRLMSLAVVSPSHLSQYRVFDFTVESVRDRELTNRSQKNFAKSASEVVHDGPIARAAISAVINLTSISLEEDAMAKALYTVGAIGQSIGNKMDAKKLRRRLFGDVLSTKAQVVEFGRWLIDHADRVVTLDQVASWFHSPCPQAQTVARYLKSASSGLPRTFRGRKPQIVRAAEVDRRSGRSVGGEENWKRGRNEGNLDPFKNLDVQRIPSGRPVLLKPYKGMSPKNEAHVGKSAKVVDVKSAGWLTVKLTTNICIAWRRTGTGVLPGTRVTLAEFAGIPEQNQEHVGSSAVITDLKARGWLRVTLEGSELQLRWRTTGYFISF